MTSSALQTLRTSLIGALFASASCCALARGAGVLDDPPERADWTPDRRPVRVITLFNGSETNPRSLSIGLYCRDDEGPPANQQEYDAILAQTLAFIQSGYEDGWRRFMLTLPAGTYGNCGAFSGNQWTALPAWKQTLYADVWAWIDDGHEDATIGVYSGGLSCTTLTSLCTMVSSACAGGYCTNTNLTFTPYAASGAGFTALDANAGGYQGIGCYEYFIDAASTNPEEMFAIFTHSNFYEIMRMGGEAIPLKVVSSVTVADPDYKNHNPWVALNEYVQWNLGGPEDTRNTFDIELSEMGLWIDHLPLTPNEEATPPVAASLAEMRTIVNRGWVPWIPPAYGVARTARFIEMIKRIYGFGVITDGGDFNMDGAITSADYDSFLTVYFAHANTQGNHVHGDFNGDTYINPDDLSDFINAYFGYDPGFDFGGPNAEYATIP